MSAKRRPSPPPKSSRLPGLAAAGVLVLVGAMLVWTQLRGGSGGPSGPTSPNATPGSSQATPAASDVNPAGAAGGGKRAVIIDQLSLTFANPDFVQAATKQLKDAGYDVDYVPGEEVSVRYYQALPTKGYDLILLRVHSARREVAGTRTDDVALFTGELIDLVKYNISGVPGPAATAVAQAKADLTAGRMAEPKGAFGSDLGPAELKAISPVYYDPGSGELPYFGLLPAFIASHLSGQFKPDSTVVLMGCDGLRSDALARAFVGRGVSEFVSWDKPVTASHTDEATQALLASLLGGRTLAEATGEAMKAVGPDPTYGSVLQLYPH